MSFVPHRFRMRFEQMLDVKDLEYIKERYIDALRFADPPVIKKDRLRGFIKEVFWNLEDILGYHKRMLNALFARQRDQHPIIQSLSDILLESMSSIVSTETLHDLGAYSCPHVWRGL